METVVMVLCWLGVFQSLLLGIYFLSNTRRNNSYLFLGIALVLISVRASKSTLFIFASNIAEPLFNIGFAAHAAIGPAILLHVWTLRKESIPSPKWVLHFVPSFIILLSLTFLTLDNFWYKGGYGVLLYYTLFYIGLYAFELYRSYKQNNLRKDISLPWVMVLLGTVSLFQLAYFSNYILGITPYTAAPVFYSVALYFITFAVLKNKAEINREPKTKYQNLRVSEAELDNYKERILVTMEKHRPYLDTTFSLQKLSTMTGIPQHVLSHTFSSVLNQSFTNFVNMHRIEVSKKILCDPEKEYLSIAGIAYECGFNSLSSFNVSFKKNIGVTPSVYKKTAQKICG